MIVNIRPRFNSVPNVKHNDNAMLCNNEPSQVSYMHSAGIAAMAAVSNPLSGIKDALDHMNSTFDNIGSFFQSVGYWINPVNLWHELGYVFSSGSLDTPLIVGTILGGILMMGGATWPKKWIFWGWVLFWILRVVFA